MKRQSTWQFITFLLVGGINTLFGYAAFAVFIYVGLHYTMAMLLATCVGIVFNFQTIGRLVFKRSEKRLILRFVLVYAVIYLLNILIVKAISHLGVSIYLSGLAAVTMTAMMSFVLNKKFVFGVVYEKN